MQGEDEISVDVKYAREPLSFTNRAKMFFSCSQTPEIKEEYLAVKRRIYISEFKNYFPMGDPKTDPNILDKITTPEELSGLLNRALATLRQLCKNKKFSGKTPEDRMEIYTRRGESYGRFFLDCCQKSGKVRFQRLFAAYQQYCRDQKLTPLPKQAFIARMKKLTPIEVTQVHGTGRYIWHGISLKPEYESNKALGERAPRKRKIVVH